MNRLVSRFRVAALALAGFAAATLAFSVAAQQPRGNAAQQAAASDTGDFTEGNLKFHHSSSGFMTVVDTEKNQSAGTVIFPPGGAPVFAPMPGYDIKAAYEKHMRGSGASQATTATMNAASAQGHADLAGFDAATKTVTLSDGRAVTFVDDENLKVQISDMSGARTYDLHFHKGSASGFMQGLAGNERGRVGGSLGGSGVTFNLEIQSGTGREVYDTAKGTVYASSGFVQAKSVTATVREAIAVIKSSAQPDLAKSNVVKSLLSNNLGI